MVGLRWRVRGLVNQFDHLRAYLACSSGGGSGVTGMKSMLTRFVLEVQPKPPPVPVFIQIEIYQCIPARAVEVGVAETMAVLFDGNDGGFCLMVTPAAWFDGNYGVFSLMVTLRV